MNSRYLNYKILLCLLLFLPGALQAVTQVVVREAVDSFMQNQIKELPGNVSYTIGTIDPRIGQWGCQSIEPFLPPGRRLWGKTSIGVRCLAPTAWTIHVPVHVSVMGDYVVASRDISSGNMILEADVMLQNGDITALPSAVLTDPLQAIGRASRNNLAAGQPVRGNQLMAALVVRQGQTVRTVSKGQGFSATSSGIAVNNAAEGQVAQVRTASGQVISGIARQGGIVEISH